MLMIADEEDSAVSRWDRLLGPHRQIDRLLERLQSLCGLGVAVVGGVNVTHWMMGASLDSIPLPDEATMAPVTATCLVLLAVAILVIPPAPGRGWRAGLAAICAGIVAVTTVVQLIKQGTPPAGIDAAGLVGSWPRWIILASSERMTEFTAIAALIASGTVLILLCVRASRAADWVALGGLAVAVMGSVFSLGNLYSILPLYPGSRIPMARGTGLSFVLVGLGLILACGPSSVPFRPLTGRSVKSRLLRLFLPYAVVIVVMSDSLTLIAARWFSPQSSALTSAVSVALAAAVAGALCAWLAGHVGRRLERAEAELRAANEQLETRVQDRTRDLRQAKHELEVKNRQLEQSHDDLKRAEQQLIQSEKLTSLGQLVAGVAHEVNNPLAYVSNNMALLERDLVQLRNLVNLYRRNDELLERHDPDRLVPIRALAEEIDLDYVLEAMPSLASRSRAGLKRIQQIILGLRDFARLDEAEIKEVDLNTGFARPWRSCEALPPSGRSPWSRT